MRGNVVQLQRLYVSERLRLGQARRRVERRAAACVDDYVLTSNGPSSPAGKFDLNCPGRDEPAIAHHQLGPAASVIVEMDVDQLLDHLALALAHCGHADTNIVLADSKFFTPKEQ